MHRWLIFFPALVVLFTWPAVSNAQETISLFDGETLDGWTMQNGDPVSAGWEVVDGMLHLSTDKGRSGNILTAEEYGDYELRFEWKIEPGGNNGLKYRVRQYGNRWLGAEYQILDDTKHRDAMTAKRSTASLYDVYPPGPAKYLKPVGEFNTSRIIVCGNRLEHWLNGQHILTAWVGSWEWQQRIADSKFSNVDAFSENRYGKIMLTDHSSQVWYRKIELTPLYGCDQPVYTTSVSHVRRSRGHCRLLHRIRCRRR